MVRISDILRRGQGEEGEPKKKPEKKKVEKEKISAKAPPKIERKISFKAARERAAKETPPELAAKEVRGEEEKPPVSQVDVARVMMEKTKAGRPEPKELYNELIDFIKAILAKAEKYEPIAGKEIAEKIDRVIDQLAISGDELIDMTNNFTQDNYLIGHSVNVCLLSIRLGLGLGYNKSKLKDLGISSFLYDIGMVKVMNIAQEPRRLTAQEYNEIKQHPLYGTEILEKAKDISKIVIYVAHEQHERWDGSGYPKKLANDKINEYARIVGLVDTYEALTHPRPHREKLPPYEAMKEILKNKNHFDPYFLKILIQEIGIYPIGSWVELNTNEVGKIARINKELPLRPTVNVIFGSDTRKLDERKIINLANHPTLYVKNDSELKSRFTTSK